LTLTAAPTGSALVATIDNPSGAAFEGRLFVVNDEGDAGSWDVGMSMGTPSSPTMRLPIPAGRHWLELRGRDGATAARIGPQRFQALPAFPVGPTASSGFQAVKFVENAARPSEPVAAVSTPRGSPVTTALSVKYNFDAGWRYLAVTPPGPAAIPAGAKSLTLWLDHRSGPSGDALRYRFRDATGQTFQPDLGRLGGPGWHALTIPLDGQGNAGHWGGADDGVPHPPLAWEGLILIDSARRNAHQGEVWLASPYYVFDR
jgi:hypothetical protein